MKIEEMLADLPEIKMERLTLRKFRLEDAADYFEYSSDPEVARFALWGPRESMEEAVEAMERNQKAYQEGRSSIWGIHHNEDNKIIGAAGFIKLDSDFNKGEIGYTFGRKYWNQGYATELSKKLIEFGFNELNLRRIEGICHSENHASVRVMEKAGMVEEGVLKSYYHKNGVYMDVRIFSIINDK